jgi:glycosidase
VAEQQNDPKSMLTFYKQMLRVRKSTPALIEGDYAPLRDEAETYLAFLRSSREQRCLVVLNYADQPQTLSFDLEASSGKLIFSSASRAGMVDLTHLEIAPFEIVIVEV